MGGGSGLGSFAIQIAKLYNCGVIATASPDNSGFGAEVRKSYMMIVEWINVV